MIHTAAVRHGRQRIVRERIVIFGQTAIHARYAGAAVFARVVVVNKRAGKLDGAVLAEVKENHAGTGFHAFIIAQYGRRDVFVHHGAAVRRLHGFVVRFHHFFGGGAVQALRADNQVVGFIGQAPIFAAVHGVVAALDSGNLAHTVFFNFFFQRADKPDRAFRWRIAAVGKKVDIYLFDAFFGGVFHNGVQVVLVGVDAFVLHQPHNVQGFMVVYAVIYAGRKRSGLK